MGGFGSAVLEFAAQNDFSEKHIHIHGIGDKFVEHGTQAELLHDLKLDAEGISEVVEDFLNKTKQNN